MLSFFDVLSFLLFFPSLELASVFAPSTKALTSSSTSSKKIFLSAAINPFFFFFLLCFFPLCSISSIISTCSSLVLSTSLLFVVWTVSLSVLSTTALSFFDSSEVLLTSSLNNSSTDISSDVTCSIIESNFILSNLSKSLSDKSGSLKSRFISFSFCASLLVLLSSLYVSAFSLLVGDSLFSFDSSSSPTELNKLSR